MTQDIGDAMDRLGAAIKERDETLDTLEDAKNAVRTRRSDVREAGVDLGEIVADALGSDADAIAGFATAMLAAQFGEDPTGRRRRAQLLVDTFCREALHLSVTPTPAVEVKVT